MAKKERENENWTCPEHGRIAMGMKRDYPRDDYGRRIPGKTRELVIDIRPNIMVPARPTYTPLDAGELLRKRMDPDFGQETRRPRA